MLRTLISILLCWILAGVQIAADVVVVGQPIATAYAANATTFAGDGQSYLSRIGLTTDGNQGTVSFWLNPAGTGSAEYIIYATSGTIQIRRDTDNKFYVILKDDAGTTLIQAKSTATITTGWAHFIASWDRTSDNLIDIYINDSGGETIDTYLSTAEDASDIDYSIFQWFVGGLGISDDLNGCISELWFSKEYVDVTVEANRRKFRSSGGAPVSLGSDGSTPTGTAPFMYLKSEFSSFTVNSGTGGNFTKEGTTALTSCTAP